MVLQQLYLSYEIQKSEKIERKIAFVEEGLFGFYRDNSDVQWRAYSDNITLMLLCMVVFLFLSKLIKRTFP